MPSPAVRPWLTCDLICSVLLDPLTQRCRRALRLACRHHPGALESPVPVHRVPSHRRVRGARCRKPGPSPWQLPLVPERDRPRPSSSPRGHWCFRSEHGAVDPSSLLQGPPCPDPRPVRSRRGVHGRRPLTDGAISAVGPFWRIERGDVRLGRHLDEIFGIRHRSQPALTPKIGTRMAGSHLRWLGRYVPRPRARSVRKIRHPHKKGPSLVVAVGHTGFHRFRKCVLRLDKLDRRFRAFNHLAAAVITLRK